MSSVIVTLSRFPDIFDGLAASVAEHEPSATKVLVTSGDSYWIANSRGWEVIRGVEPFVFARNANIGIAAYPGSDVLLINDDCRLISPVVDSLRRLSTVVPDVGIVAPQIRGGVGNSLQREQVGKCASCELSFSVERLAFVCVYIPRRTIDLVGPLDEQFTGYGGDDVDYCYRVRQAGLKLGVARRVTVIHGNGQAGGFSTSFARVMTPAERTRSMAEMDALALKKRGGAK